MTKPPAKLQNKLKKVIVKVKGKPMTPANVLKMKRKAKIYLA